MSARRWIVSMLSCIACSMLSCIACSMLSCIACSMLPACSPSSAREGLDPSSLPDDVRADYGVFAQRCSKCHSLSRPLDSGITDDEFWQRYVERMRRMPSSGIAPRDAAPILRFLHYYSLQQRARKEGR